MSDMPGVRKWKTKPPENRQHKIVWVMLLFLVLALGMFCCVKEVGDQKCIELRKAIENKRYNSAGKSVLFAGMELASPLLTLH